MKNLITTIIFSFLVFGIHICTAQEFQWAPKQKEYILHRTFLSVENGDFFTFYQSNSNATNTSVQFSPCYIDHYSGLVKDFEGKVELKINEKQAYFENALIIKGEMYVFLSLKKEGVFFLYAQKYGKDCKPVGDAIELVHYDHEYKASLHSSISDSYDSSFKIKQSKSENFFVVFYEINNVRTEKQKIGAVVFDPEFNTISKAEHTCEFECRELGFKDFYLSDKGQFFCGSFVLADKEKAKLMANASYQDYVLYAFSDNQVLGRSLANDFHQMNNRTQISKFSFKEGEDDNLIIATSYKDFSSEECGIFLYSFNSTDLSLISKLTAPISGKQKEDFYEYMRIKDFALKDNGGAVILLEGRWARVTLFSISANDSFDWYKEMPGFGCTTFFDSKSCVYFCEDERTKYDNNGIFLESATGDSSDWRAAQGLVKLVFSYEEGYVEKERKMIDQTNKNDIRCNLDRFVWNIPQKTVLTLAEFNRNSRIGFIKY